jgi:hypothetical protein
MGYAFINAGASSLNNAGKKVIPRASYNIHIIKEERI